MDGKFLMAMGAVSTLGFGSVWMATAPGSPAASQGSGPMALAAPAHYQAAPTAAPPSSVYYAGCNAVRAAGKAPLYAGQPGYRPEMDGDSDGIACEPHRDSQDGGGSFGRRRRF